MFDINEKSIIEIQQALENNEITSKQLVLAYAKRIATIDSCENGLNSILEFNSDAIFIAEKLDKERKKGIIHSKLHGIPILIKDNINTADTMHTSGGSLALVDNYAPYDADIVKNLKNAGAIIMGKANMTEFANYMTYNMPGGYSSRGGQVLSPYKGSFGPSGSSAGSGVAVTANLCSVAIGTETSGSILCPARNNSIVGFKPSIGLYKGTGIIPISSTLDTAGPMTRTVMDAAILLNGMTDQENTIDYSAGLNINGLDGIRIGINRGNINIVDSDTLENFENTLILLKNAGAIIIDDINIGYNKAIRAIMKYEFKNCLNHYLSTLSNKISMKNLDDIIEFNKQNPEKYLKYKQTLLKNAKYGTSGRVNESEYLLALNEREKAFNEITNIMDKKNIDVILHIFEYNNLAPLTGMPSITIPFGVKSSGQPLGSNWMARRYDDETLLKITYAAEQLLQARIVPTKHMVSLN